MHWRLLKKRSAFCLSINIKANIYEEGTLADWQKYSTVLVISSTTGQGDLPDTIAPLFYELRDNVGYQPNLHYGLIALGDSLVTIIFVVQVCNLKRYYKSIKQKRIGEILKIDSMDIAEPEVFAINWLENWATLLN